jgi:hypothetical protein
MFRSFAPILTKHSPIFSPPTLQITLAAALQSVGVSQLICTRRVQKQELAMNSLHALTAEHATSHANADTGDVCDLMDVADYVSDMADQLATLANGARLTVAAHYLAVAAAEARRTARLTARRPAGAPVHAPERTSL